MSEPQGETAELKAPAKRKTKKRKAAKPAVAARPVKDGPFAGITAKDCPAACTATHCVISTVGLCKHPYKSSVNGCGAVTMENREKARKLIMHQMVETQG